MQKRKPSVISVTIPASQTLLAHGAAFDSSLTRAVEVFAEALSRGRDH